MKCDLISGTFNQIPSNGEILPDVNHSGIYNTQNSQQTYALESIFESCGTRMSDNEQSQQREGWTQTSISRKKTLSQIDVYGSLLDGKQHQSLARPDKIKFLNEPKQTELNMAQETWCQHHAHHTTYVWPLTWQLLHHSQTALFYYFFFFLKNSSTGHSM